MKNLEIIVQARMSSTRMPGKVLKPFYNDLNLLDIQMASLRKTGYQIKIATSLNSNDDAIEKFANRNKIEIYRGKENDVLSRFIECANSDYIIRICSDNPFLNVGSLDALIENIDGEVDYISYKDYEGTPAIRTHWGLFPEVVKTSALHKAYHLLEDEPDKGFYVEHVTNFIYGHEKYFSIKLLDAPEAIFKRQDLRFTIDTQKDFKHLSSFYEHMISKYRSFSIEDLVGEADKNHELKRAMNEGIKKFSK